MGVKREKTFHDAAPLRRSPRAYVCLANSEFLRTALALGVYGNRWTKQENGQPYHPRTRWSIIRDLIPVREGDRVFFYELGEKVLHGIFEADSGPIVCNDSTFASQGEKYPFRFKFRPLVTFEHPVPVFELLHLIDTHQIWSLVGLENDPTGPYRSIINITYEESAVLERALAQYNPGRHLPASSFGIAHVPQARIEAVNVVDGMLPSSDHILIFQKLPTKKAHNSVVVSYEYALQAWLANQLADRQKKVRELFGDYSEFLTEVPLSPAEARRIDLLIMYRGVQQEPSTVIFYLLVELKASDAVELENLNQLLGYLRIFTLKKGLNPQQVGGMLIAPDYKHDVLQYARNRKQVEVERPIRLVKYEIDNSGDIQFRDLTP